MTPEPTIDVEAFKKFERDGYSSVARGYDRTTAAVTSQVNQAVLDAVAAGPGVSLLDIACGPGWLSAAAAQRGTVVSALDFAENMVLLARSRCPEADVRNGDAESLPFEPGRFDAVVCSFGILHLPNPERAVAEAYRVLKPGGRYAFTCWLPPARNPFFGLILGSIQRHGSMNVNLPVGPSLFRFGDPAECEKILTAAGFVSVSMTELPILWPFAKPEDVVPAVLASTARVGPMLAMQTPEQRHNIENAIAEGAKSHATPRGVEIPAPALLAVGRKP
jgi:ubiquinone/menaquinone biosynthesis C-methylase UbiE